MGNKGNETRKAILAAAETLFAKKGFKDVTMSDLCEITGLSRGGLYRYYSSTSEVFRELISADYSPESRMAHGDSALSILSDTLAFVGDALRRPEKSLSLAIYEFANTGDNRALFTEIAEKAKTRWTALIRYGISRGEFAPVDPDAVAEMILYYYQGLRMWSRVISLDEKMISDYTANVFSALAGGNTNGDQACPAVRRP